MKTLKEYIAENEGNKKISDYPFVHHEIALSNAYGNDRGGDIKQATKEHLDAVKDTKVSKGLRKHFDKAEPALKKAFKNHETQHAARERDLTKHEEKHYPDMEKILMKHGTY